MKIMALGDKFLWTFLRLLLTHRPIDSQRITLPTDFTQTQRATSEWADAYSTNG